MLRPMWRKYIYIVAWHKMTGSFDYYIDRLVRKAVAEHAPTDSIYFGVADSGPERWVTLRDIESAETLVRVVKTASDL